MIVSLPPSINKAYVFAKRLNRFVWTKEAKQYKESVAWMVKAHMIENDLKTQADYFYLDMRWWLPRRNCDSHNYKKILFDMLQNAGFVSDDRYIMDRTQGVEFDSKNPRVLLEVVK